MILDFSYSFLRRETGGFELAVTITPVLEVDQLTKCVSHPKALHGGTNSFGQIYGWMFYIGINDQIMQEAVLMVKRFQRSSYVSLSLVNPDLGYSYII